MKVWTAFLVIGAAASVVAWLVALCHENRVCPFAAAARFVRGLPWGGRLAVLPLFAALIVYGSVKNSGGVSELGVEGTNQVSGRVESVDGVDNVANVEVLPVTNANTQLGNGEWGTGNVSHRIDKIDRIGENAVVCDDWLRFGAHEDWIYIGPGAWSSRFGSNFVEKVRVLSCGGIDFFPEGHISLLNNPISIAPAANWHLLSVSNSMFWYAETPSNTLVLTWQNALLNRQADSPVNIQAELFPSGRMRITHDLSGEAVTEYRPAPELPPHVSLDEVRSRFADGNTNAYYYADVVVEKGPSIVTVRCDAETALGDYAVAAYPGETNRLPFLIGPQYEVESEAAFAHFGVADCEVIKTNFTDRIVGLQWPVEISFEEGYAGSGKMFEMSVVPNFLKGSVFVGDSRGRSRAAGCPCGCDVDTNGVVRISEACNCDPCTISGSYGYEGYSEEFEFNYYPEEDGEDWDPDNPEDPGGPPEESKPSATIWFDKSAVIFEDEYENEPGVVVPRRSTRVKLTCCAYGGELGGNFTVDLSGMGALKLVSGTPPSSRTIAPYETVTFEAEYEAEKSSSQKDGTVARVKITENETNQVFDDDDEMTVVRVEVEPKVRHPSQSINRHVFGVCEGFECRVYPNGMQVSWDEVEDIIWDQKGNGYCSGFMPTYSCAKNLTLRYSEESFDVHLSCVTPSGIDVRIFALSSGSGVMGRAGDIGMFLDYSLLPSTVSFAGLRVLEESSSYGVHTGYFSDPSWSSKWYHTLENGAGTWHTVDSMDNFYARDRAYIGYCEEPWSAGVLSWEIPNVWLPPTGRGGESIPQTTTFKVIWQTMSITSDGTVSVSKHGHTVSRSTNNVITINGVVWQ